MILTSFNVNGVRACAKKGLLDWVSAFEPDVVLLQETKARVDDLPKDLVEIDGYVTRYHAAQKKGYSGVAVYAKHEPDEWIEGVGDERFDSEGRVLCARWGDLVVGSVYVPNSQTEGKRLDYRMVFNETFAQFLDGQRQQGRAVVIGGDFNVAHRPIDLARPKDNENNPGYLPEERAWMDGFLDDDWVDTWRARNPDQADVYSWWSYRTRARDKNIGWRLDYFCVDRENAWPRVTGAGILGEIEGSDHCPVTLELAD